MSAQPIMCASYRKTPRLVVLVAMIVHAVKTGHHPAYGSVWDGPACYITCLECGARLRYATMRLRGAR